LSLPFFSFPSPEVALFPPFRFMTSDTLPCSPVGSTFLSWKTPLPGFFFFFFLFFFDQPPYILRNKKAPSYGPSFFSPPPKPLVFFSLFFPFSLKTEFPFVRCISVQISSGCFPFLRPRLFYHLGAPRDFDFSGPVSRPPPL